MLLGSVVLSHHNKDLEWRTLKPPQRVTALGSWTDRVIALRQISVTALFYLEVSRRIHPQNVRAYQDKQRTHAGERQRKCFGSSFDMFFPPPGPALRKLGLARSAVCST